MSTRWWAPTRPTTEPDEVVKALLTPGDDARMDLASYVLAAHRAGAAALEEVSKSAVPSESSVITAMATAREHLAPTMVDAVSTHLPAAYSGLLVRDLLDDAEEGALRVFRTAVNKGVAPPIAAQRAGAVYGVPLRRLGDYISVASDPKSNPVAVADKADRLLLKHAELVGEGETSPVSKADDDWDESKHPRHGDGRFRHKGTSSVKDRPAVRAQRPVLPQIAQLRSLFGGGQSAPTVGTTAKEKAEQKQIRRIRQIRRPASAQQAQAQVQSAQPQTAAAKPQQAQTMRAQVKQAMTQAVQALGLNQTQLSPPKPARKKKQQKEPRGLSGPMSMVTTEAPIDSTIHQDLVVHADSRVWNNLSAQVSQQSGEFADPTRRILRVGHLLGKASAPEAAESSYARHSLQGVEASVLDRYGDAYVQPTVSHVYEEDIAGVFGGDVGGTDLLFGPRPLDKLTELLSQKKLEVTGREWVGRDGTMMFSPDPMEDANTVVLPTYTPHGVDDVDIDGNQIGPMYSVVNFRPDNQTGARVRPTVDEFVLASPQGLEEYGSTPGRANYTLDDNTVYEVYAPEGIRGEFGWVDQAKHMAMYDHEQDVVVRRWYLRPISEDEADEIIGGPGNVGKALVGAELARFNMQVHRDEDGRFASSGRRSSSPVAAPASAAAVVDRPSVVGDSDLDEVSAPSTLRRPAKPRQIRRIRQIRRPAAATQTASTAAARPAAAQVARAAAAPAATQGVSLQQAMARSSRRRDTPSRSLPVFSDFNEYKLMSTTDFDDTFLAEDQLLSDLGPGESAQIRYSNSRRGLAERESTKPINLPRQMANYVRDAQDRSGMSTKMVGVYKLQDPGETVSDTDRLGLANKLTALFEEHAQMEMVEIVRRGNRLTIYSTPMVAPPQVVVQVDPEINLATDRDLMITKVGTFRGNDIMMDIKDAPPTTLVDVTGKMQQENSDVEGMLANPRLEVYQITNPTVEHWRVD